MSNELPWFKFYTEALNDPKFDVVANDNNMQPWEVLGIWTSLLCIAANSPIRGTLAVSNLRGLSIADLKSIIHWNDNYWDNTEFQDLYHFEKLIQSFIELDMLTLDEYGSYKITNFVERQETKEEHSARLNRERQKRYQETHKEPETVIDTVINNVSIEENNVINNDDITPSSISSSISISNSLSDSLTESYTKYIGEIKPAIITTLQQAEKDYQADWFDKAFEIAVGSGHKNWSYIEGILKNWKVAGIPTGKNGKKPGKPRRDTAEARRRYGEWDTTK